MISKKDILYINQNTKIDKLVSEYVKLEKAGKNLKGLCPFHSDTKPSFSVSTELNYAKCFSCGEGGDPITFFSKINKISFAESAVKLAERLNYQISNLEGSFVDNESKKIFNLAQKFFKTCLLKSEEGKEGLLYLTKRKIDLENDIIKKFEFGFAPNKSNALLNTLKINKINLESALDLSLLNKIKDDYIDFFKNRLIIPIKNQYGEIIAFSGRSITSDDNVKYLNSENNKFFVKGKTLYNINNIEKKKPVFIVEGFFDVIAMTLAKMPNTISQMGTALTRDHMLLLKEYTDSIILIYDGDNAGFNAIIKNYPIILRYGFNLEVVILKDLENGKIDPDSFLKKYGDIKLFNFINENKQDIYSFLINYYQQNLNLENNADLSKYFNLLYDLFKNADPNIIKKYENILSNKFGYEISLNKYKKYQNKKNNNFIETKIDSFDYNNVNVEYSKTDEIINENNLDIDRTTWEPEPDLNYNVNEIPDYDPENSRTVLVKSFSKMPVIDNIQKKFNKAKIDMFAHFIHFSNGYTFFKKYDKEARPIVNILSIEETKLYTKIKDNLKKSITKTITIEEFDKIIQTIDDPKLNKFAKLILEKAKYYNQGIVSEVNVNQNIEMLKLYKETIDKYKIEFKKYKEKIKNNEINNFKDEAKKEIDLAFEKIIKKQNNEFLRKQSEIKRK